MIRSSSRGSTSKRSGLAAVLLARCTSAATGGLPGSTATTPQHSLGASASACSISASSSAGTMSTRSPPHCRVQVLDLLDGERVDAARKVLPAVVGDDEHDVALVELARYAHGDARDRAAGDAREQALLVEQLARPDDRVEIGDEDLAVQQREIDDRRAEAVVERAQALHG